MPHPRAASPIDRLQALRIMLIDGDAAFAAALRTAVERAGMQTCWVSSGADAVAQTARFHPDIVLTDLMVPGTDGLSLVKWLVTSSASGGHFGIIVVNDGDEADRVTALELGADDYVVKPPNMREVIARIRAVHRRVGYQSIMPALHS